MAEQTTNIGLQLTGADETEMSFLEWRTAMNGETGNSNMELIDAAIGKLMQSNPEHEYRKLYEETADGTKNLVMFSKDMDGNSFKVNELFMFCVIPATDYNLRFTLWLKDDSGTWKSTKASTTGAMQKAEAARYTETRWYNRMNRWQCESVTSGSAEVGSYTYSSAGDTSSEVSAKTDISEVLIYTFGTDVKIPEGTKIEVWGRSDRIGSGSNADVTKEAVESALGYAPVKDVRIAGTSILADGVADVPKCQGDDYGVVRANNQYGYGVGVNNNGILYTVKATDTQINNRQSNFMPITPTNMDYAIKATMTDGKGAAWTAAEQAAARDRMGIDKPWELIEEVEFAEEAMFLRTQEPDGTPYNFTELMLKAEFPPTSKTGNIPLYFIVGALQKNVNSYFISPRDESATKYGFSKVWRANQHYRSGWWTCVHNVGEYATYYENPLSVDKIPISEGNVTGVNIGVALDAGTKIRIYGVRA